jgi:hypothetical protein
MSSDGDAGETSGHGIFAESKSRQEIKVATSSSEKVSSWRSWTVSPTRLVDLESGAIIDVFVQVVVVVVVVVVVLLRCWIMDTNMKGDFESGISRIWRERCPEQRGLVLSDVIWI